MDLPKELRLSIYELLLVPGTITIQYDNYELERWCYDKRYDSIKTSSLSETQIFLVSKQVMDEALPLYATQNLFLCHGMEGVKVVAGVYGGRLASM